MARKSPLESLKLEESLLEQVSRSYWRLMDILKSWRDRFGKNRLVKIDNGMGRRKGYSADFIRGRDTITLDRLLAFAAMMDRTLQDLIEEFGSFPRIPPGPQPGYFRAFAFSRSKIYSKLAAWALQMEIGKDGFYSSFDHEALISKAQEDPQQAISIAEKHVEMLLEIAPVQVNPESTKSLCWVLGILASLYRTKGDLRRSLELLEIAFSIEANLEEFTTRAFLFRDAAYLLSHLGHFREAERCAKSAIDLSLVAPNGKGLGESLYVRAFTIKWQGDYAEALLVLRGALPHLEDSSLEFKKSAALEMTWLFIESGKVEKAAHWLTSATEELERLPPIFRARVHLAHAVLYSIKGNRPLAEDHFEKAWEIMEECGSPSDRSLALLRICSHRIKFSLGLNDLVDVVIELAQKMERGSTGEAALLEVSRHIVAGELTQERVRVSIAALNKPWTCLKQVES